MKKDKDRRLFTDSLAVILITYAVIRPLIKWLVSKTPITWKDIFIACLTSIVIFGLNERYHFLNRRYIEKKRKT